MPEQHLPASLTLAVHGALEVTRSDFGPPPRRLSWFKSLILWPHRPLYMHHDNRRLSHVYYDYRELLRHGRLAWAHLVQANELLFRPGRYDHPAAVLYRPLPCSVDEGAHLAEMAAQLYFLKGRTAEAEPGLVQLAAAITDEMTAIYHYRIPVDRLTSGDVFYTTIMVCRKHLPNGVLAQSSFPLLVDTPRLEAAMILPSQYWAPQLLSLWRNNSF